jgi:SAM-dependent methyltransferase
MPIVGMVGEPPSRLHAEGPHQQSGVHVDRLQRRVGGRLSVWRHGVEAYVVESGRRASYAAGMNQNHARVCTSPEWALQLQTSVLSPLAGALDPGDEMLELGPGPGAATEWLRHRVRRLVAVEYDPEAAAALVVRFAGTNVEVRQGDATALEFGEAEFDAVGSFTMLHHVPTPALQNRLLAEALRVLRPGGVLLGSDSLASDRLHHFHEGDTYNPVEPSALLVRLQTLGFERITVSVDQRLVFRAHKPSVDEPVATGSPLADDATPPNPGAARG